MCVPWKDLWRADDPEASTWSEILSVDPLIIHAWPSIGFPVGSASVVGPLIKDRPAHFFLRPAGPLEPEHSHRYAAEAARSYLAAHPLHHLTFLGNHPGETRIMTGLGFDAQTFNQNALVNEWIFRPLPDVPPIYDAVYNARLSPEKRIELAAEVDRLACLYFYNAYDGPVSKFHAEHARLSALLPRATFINPLNEEGCERFPPERVNAVLAQSRTGLCLSYQEGGMVASIEYLMAGLPIVSTPSVGGRDYFFDDEYCTIVEPDPVCVRDGVRNLIARRLDRAAVRAKTLARVERERARYIASVQSIIDNFPAQWDPKLGIHVT